MGGINNQKGLFIFPSHTDEDQLIELALQHGADDVEQKTDQSIDVITAPHKFHEIKTIFDHQNLAYDTAQITMIPTTSVLLPESDSEKVIELIESLEDDDDVQTVHANLEINVE